MFKSHCLKIVSMFMAVALLLLWFPLFGLIETVHATDGQALQMLVDNTASGGTLTLSRDYTGKKNSWGYNESVNITKPITIMGPSGGFVKLDWIRFNIKADGVTFKNLRFEKSDDLGGVFNNTHVAPDNKAHKNLTIENCLFDFEKNKNVIGEKRVPWLGNAIELKDISGITIKNCTFKYCEAEQDGGAIYLDNADECKIISCTFENNRATSSGSQDGTGVGGAVYITGSDGAEIKSCTFKFNFAEQYGGAVFFKRSKNVSVTDSTFTQNDSTPGYAIVQGPYGMGAALALKNTDSAVVTRCTFQSNTAYMGGGLFAAESSLTVENSSFYSNEVDRKATIGVDLMRKILETSLTALILDAQSIIELIANYALTATTCPAEFASEFTKGTGKLGGEGGGIYAINSQLIVNKSMFSGNNAEKLGGGIYIAGNYAIATEIKDSTFQINIADSGGGAIANLMPGMVADNCIIKNNVSEAGGGIYSVAGCTVTNTSFTSNTASLGGAVCANAINNTQAYANCMFSGNYAQSGGAVYAHGAPMDESGKDVGVTKCRVNLDSCEFTGNNALKYAGAITAYYLDLHLDKNTFSQNKSGAYGGVLYITNKTTLNAADCEFLQNESDRGGVVYSSGDAAFYACRSKFQNNIGNTGAGVIHDVSGRVTLANDLFTGNKTKNQLATNGSILYLDATDACNVTNCTVANNYPSASPNNMSAAYMISGAKLTLRNNIILSNTVPENVSAKDVTKESSCTVDAKYNMCALSGTGNVTGTIDVFNDPIGSDYRLRYDFMWGYLGAMEAGANDAGAYKIDLDNKTRVIDNDGDGAWKIDLGCYEQQYVRITFGIDQAKGTISGETVQWILRGTKPDLSAVTITPAAGYEFDHWETASGVVFDENAVFYYGRTVYAIMEPKKISVAFEYDTTKLTVANAGSGSKEPAEGTMERFVMSVPYNTVPVFPSMKGIDGWQFDKWSGAPGPVTANVLVTASAKPTVTYDLGTAGYYVDGTTQISTWVTSQCDPLSSPNGRDIAVNPGKEFLGWSETQGGSVTALPGSITEPKKYYAVYGTAQVHLAVEKGVGTISTDPTGEYDYGTIINLSDPTKLRITPPANSYFIGFEDGLGNIVDLNELILAADTTITAQYADVPTGTLTVKTDTSKGVIDMTAAGGLGFSGTTAEITKTTPSGAEDLMSIIEVQGYWHLAGFTAAVNGSDVTLTAIYKESFYMLLLDFLNTFNPWRLAGFSGAFEPEYITLGTRDKWSNIPLSTGGTVDFSAYGYYAYGTVIDLSTIPANPDPGYRFIGWQNESGQFITSVTLMADTEITAVFEPITYTLTVLKSGSGSVDALLPGTYYSGDVVALDAGYAAADSGYTFIGYQDESGTFTSSILMDGDKTVTAIFDPDSCALTLESDGNGSVDGNCFILTETGASIDLSSTTCTPDEGYVFSHWENEDGQMVDTNYTVTGDQTLTAVFETVKYTLSVTCQSSGSIKPGLAGTYAQGSTVYLYSSFAQPDSGYMFEGFLDGNGNHLSSITMDADRMVSAKFSAQQYPLNIYTKTDDWVKPYSTRWYASGTEVKFSSISISVSGMRLEGWLNEDLDSVSSVMVNNETTVYAVLDKISSPSEEEETETPPSSDPPASTEPETSPPSGDEPEETDASEPVASTEPETSPPPSDEPVHSTEPETSPPLSDEPVHSTEPETSPPSSDEPEESDAAEPVSNVTNAGFSWYWWVLGGAGVLIGGGVLIGFLVKNAKKKRTDLF